MTIAAPTALAAPFVRTVLGDIISADLGVTYAHEHLVIDGGRMVELSPDFLLDDVDKVVEEVGSAVRLGLRSVIDAMPCDMGRNVVKLADVSRRGRLHVVASTGLHLETLYAEDHWSQRLPVDKLAERFIADVVDGIDENDDHSVTVIRAPHRAGVIKVAGGGSLSARDVRVFQAAAAAHCATGVPILTHCTDGMAALEQVRLLTGAGVPPGAITLSHTDKVVDRAYHREIVASGAFVEYDQAFRWPSGAENGTLSLLGWMLEDGFGDRLMLGLDAARQGYWSAYGGRPGMAFLLDDFSAMMDTAGITVEARHRIFVENPARAFAFTSATLPPRPPRRHDVDRPPGGLLTSTAGSYARPSWLFAGLTAAERGEIGEADVAELLDDAVDLAIREQEAAGIDILTDGEMRRAGFFTAAFYGHLTGLRPLPPGRLVGPAGHDQQHRFEVLEPITAPTGLGVVAEFAYARAHTAKPLKMTIPGPFTLSGRLTFGPGQVYPDRLAAAWAFVPILNAELHALAAAGVDFVQVDEPSPAIHPEAQADFADLLNTALEGIGGLRVAVHLLLRQLHGPAAGQANLSPGARVDARLSCR